MADQGWVSVLGWYAARLHARAGPGHHVVSPLGAWMLVALCSPLADDREMAEVLGADRAAAARFAARLLSEPHPLVGVGAGFWVRAPFDTDAIGQWRTGLPDMVDTGDIPTPGELDAWAAERTLGLIERFPGDVGADVVSLLATVVATRVSWELPFDVVDAVALEPSPWATRLERVLQAPTGDPRHDQFITATERAGLVAVHLTRARGGLLVGSVIAADPAVTSDDVLAVAEQIVTTEARESGGVARRPLFDLPLGDGAVWSVREAPVDTPAPDGREEHFLSVLPAWSADTDVGLDDETLGFPAAARALGGALGNGALPYEARQAATARYSAVGFEASAVTGLMHFMSRPATRPGLRRVATVRFGHPFAVIAAAVDDRTGTARTGPTPWHGLPVFSAWVTEPADARALTPL